MQSTNTTMESSKKELTLQINSFDKPKELSDVKAWSQLILNLLYLRPGTYPSLPEMGIDIEKYQFDFLDNAVSELSTKIIDQQQTYLPDVPLNGVQIGTVNNGADTVLVIQLIFNTSDGVTSSAIAINTSERHFLDFDVSWE